jgi:hypothetical protein
VEEIGSHDPRVQGRQRVLKNFLIVGTQRTGSTALVRSLTFHPDIACGDEWTQHVPAHRKFAVTERALRGDFSVLTPIQRKRIEPAFGPQSRWLGFKLLFRSSAKWLLHPRLAPALWLDRFAAYHRWIAARPGLHVIHIVRRDPVDWLKSKYLADTSRAYAAKAYPEDLTISIPVREALRRLEAKRWIDERLSTLDATNPYLCVGYEEFLDSDRSVVERLMGFLDCDPARLRDFDYRKQRKQSKRPASDYITNFAELTAALGRNSVQS